MSRSKFRASRALSNAYLRVPISNSNITLIWEYLTSEQFSNAKRYILHEGGLGAYPVGLDCAIPTATLCPTKFANLRKRVKHEHACGQHMAAIGS